MELLWINHKIFSAFANSCTELGHKIVAQLSNHDISAKQIIDLLSENPKLKSCYATSGGKFPAGVLLHSSIKGPGLEILRSLNYASDVEVKAASA